MNISKKELQEHGVEVDMPVEWNRKPTRQLSIRFKDGHYELFELMPKRGEVHYRYRRLEDLVRVTNGIYDYNDKVVE